MIFWLVAVYWNFIPLFFSCLFHAVSGVASLLCWVGREQKHELVSLQIFLFPLFFVNLDQLTLKLCHHLPSLTVISDTVHVNFILQMKVMFIKQILHPGAFRRLLDCLFLKAITFHLCSTMLNNILGISASAVFEMALAPSLAS